MIIRPARPSDVPQLVRLCAAHAAYEQVPPVPENLAELLTAALSAPDRAGIGTGCWSGWHRRLV